MNVPVVVEVGTAHGLRATWLVLLAAALSLALTDPFGWLPAAPSWLARVVLVAKAGLFLGFVIVNWTGAGRLLRGGFVLVVAGLVANGIPSLVYGAMPYATRSAEISGMTPAQVAEGSEGHLPVQDVPVVLRPLADVIPLPGLRTVMSAGDLLLLVGVVLGTVAVIGRRRCGRTRLT